MMNYNKYENRKRATYISRADNKHYFDGEGIFRLIEQSKEIKERHSLVGGDQLYNYFIQKRLDSSHYMTDRTTDVYKQAEHTCEMSEDRKTFTIRLHLRPITKYLGLLGAYYDDYIRPFKTKKLMKKTDFGFNDSRALENHFIAYYDAHLLLGALINNLPGDLKVNSYYLDAINDYIEELFKLRRLYAHSIFSTFMMDLTDIAVNTDLTGFVAPAFVRYNSTSKILAGMPKDSSSPVTIFNSVDINNIKDKGSKLGCFIITYNTIKGTFPTYVAEAMKAAYKIGANTFEDKRDVVIRAEQEKNKPSKDGLKRKISL